MRRSEAEREAEPGRSRFRELLEQYGGTVTTGMKKVRANYLDQEEAAQELENLTAEKEKPLGDFLVLHGVELFSLLSMKHHLFSRNSGEYAPGVITGVNDVGTFYYGFVMQRIAETGRNFGVLMFRDDVLSLTGITSAGSAKSDRKKKKLI